jgi:hypothetical protein
LARFPALSFVGIDTRITTPPFWPCRPANCVRGRPP